MKCLAFFTFYIFSPNGLINSTEHERSRKILSVYIFLGSLTSAFNMWYILMVDVESMQNMLVVMQR